MKDDGEISDNSKLKNNLKFKWKKENSFYLAVLLLLCSMDLK